MKDFEKTLGPASEIDIMRMGGYIPRNSVRNRIRFRAVGTNLSPLSEATSKLPEESLYPDVTENEASGCVFSSLLEPRSFGRATMWSV